MKENCGEIVEEEGPVEYDPDERDYRAEWYKVQCNEDIHGASKDWKGHDPDIPEPSDFVEELLDTLDQQKKELDKSIRNEANLIDRLSLKEIVFDQLYKKHDTLCKAYEVQEEENLKNLKRLEKERDRYKGLWKSSHKALLETTKSHIKEREKMQSVVAEYEVSIMPTLEEYNDVCARCSEAEKELDKSIRNEAHLIEHLSLKDIALKQCKKEGDELKNGSKFNRDQVYYVEGLNKELKKGRDSANERVEKMQSVVAEYMKAMVDLREERDVRYSLEQIEEALTEWYVLPEGHCNKGTFGEEYLLERAKEHCKHIRECLTSKISKSDPDFDGQLKSAGTDLNQRTEKESGTDE